MSISQGIHSIPEEYYHNDPCDEPSFSASLAKTILNKSVYHAWMEHPRFGGIARKPSSAMNLGTVAHKLFLDKTNSGIHRVDHPDYRTKAAKEDRDNAIGLGMTPILTKDYDVVCEMVGEAREFMSKTEFYDFEKTGKTEQTLIAFNECWMRGRADYISDDRKLIIDYKTVSKSTNPHDFKKTIFNMGYDIQAGMYCYLNKLISNVDAIYIWLVQETESPYSCFLDGADSSLIQDGLDETIVARGMWANALKTGEFKAHGTDIEWVSPPKWKLERTNNLIYKSGE